jgi:hypothetical protein
MFIVAGRCKPEYNQFSMNKPIQSFDLFKMMWFATMVEPIKRELREQNLGINYQRTQA